jgi:hypothetical protein
MESSQYHFGEVGLVQQHAGGGCCNSIWVVKYRSPKSGDFGIQNSTSGDVEFNQL